MWRIAIGQYRFRQIVAVSRRILWDLDNPDLAILVRLVI
jgi:hypothetical protein